ncbi:hypothetical protein L7F22_055340 [Adiantum nelumboides]|nr:hypothetical protein [Adiantum nelumboides]
MLMVVTGDHPAQCKIGLFKDGGQHFCRLDKAIASLDSSNPSFVGRYIYDKTCLQCRYPPPKRTMAEMQKALSLSVKTTSQSQPDDILKNAGLSGKSSLWRLNDLYGFDLSLDLVYDTMHILSLNIFQKYISLLMRNSSSEMKRKIDDITARALSCVPPTLRYGRWPRYPSKYHESYKAEENQEFIQWCLPFVLCEVDGLPSDIQDLGLLLIDIAHLFFNYTRDHGWTNKTIEVARTLLSSWRVRSEEAFGANSSPLEHVAGSGEILDDVLRHGNHDVIWCFLYERLVSTYVNIKSNNKESEISFTNFHRRRLLTWILAQIHKDKDDLLPHQRLYKELHLALIAPAGYVVDSLLQHECQAWHKHGILKVSSVLKAKDLWSALLSNEIDYPCGDSVFDKGIIIGPKRQKWRELSRAEQRFLSQRECRSTHVQEHNKIWYNGEVFKGGDMVIVKSDNYIPGSFSVGEWKARIKYFFSAQCGAKLMLFFAADYYKQSILVEEESERLNVEPITGMSVLQQTPMPFTWNCIREVNSLLHKFIPWSFENSIIAYEIKDLSVRKRLLDVGFVGCVPPWVEEMDIVQIKEYDDRDSSTHTFAYAVVREVDVERRKVRLTRLLQMQSSAQLWKAGVEDLDWQDTSLCVAVFLTSNASQGEHDPKNGNLDLNVAMIEEESHSGSEHERTPTTMNLENLDSELENNLEHQSFVSLLISGNLKRVRAIPQSPKMGMASQLVSKPTSAPLQVLQQDGESTRKSKRERKMSAKLRNSVTGKKPRLLSRKKKRQCPEPDKLAAPEARQPKPVPVRAITRNTVVIEELPNDPPAQSKLNPQAKEWNQQRSTWKEKGKAKEYDEWKEQRELATKIIEKLEKKKPKVCECSEARAIHRIPVAEALLLDTQNTGAPIKAMDSSENSSSFGNEQDEIEGQQFPKNFMESNVEERSVSLNGLTKDTVITSRSEQQGSTSIVDRDSTLPTDTGQAEEEQWHQ